MGVKNFKRLLISRPKCIELNSESKPKLILVLGSHPGPRPNIYFFFGVKCLIASRKLFGNNQLSLTIS